MLRRWAALRPGVQWLAGAAAVVLVLAIAWALFVPVADALAHHDVGSVMGPLHETALDNARGRLLTAAAGLFVLGALVFTALTYNLSRVGQVTDRYTKAVEQLGSDKLDVRIGGIYALERVARDSARDHLVVMEVLTAFIREHSREPWPLPGPDEEDADLVESTRPDVQAAVTVVGRRDARRDTRHLDLGGARYINLAGARLPRADLRGADLARADLKGADLTAAELVGANLQGASLWGAYLHGARLQAAHLQRAGLRGARLDGAHLNAARLTQADLTEASLPDADLGGADLSGATLGRADLTRARLADADLAGAKLYNAVLTYAGLQRANLAGANLAEANLAEAMLPGADLPGATLARAVLTDATLAGSDLTGADLASTDFTRAIMSHVNLARARLFSTNLSGAELAGADLAEAEGLTTADLTDANLAGASWPEGMPVPEGWERHAGSGRLRHPGT
jgi:uncharacterized protein YjbI with pentapeptide repeats